MHAYINILAYFNALLTSTHTCACMYVCYTLVKWVGTWSSDTASCVHICAYMQPCMHVYAHAFIHAYLHAYMLGVHDAPAYMHTLTYTFSHTDMYSCTCKLACIHMHAHRYAYALLCRHEYGHATQPYMHTYTCTPTCGRMYTYITYMHTSVHTHILICLHVGQILRTCLHLLTYIWYTLHTYIHT
jgi:hypothetical protein